MRPLKAADQITTFKMAVRTIADLYGLYADFSPMPLQDQPGNGYHINLYAADKDGNDLALHAAAGILEVARDITIFLNPTDDSYSRLGSSSAPDRADWSAEGKSELMYIESFNGRTRAELRSPDASCNPYLVFALLIHAGLSGIERRLTLPEEPAENGSLLPASKKEAGMLAAKSAFVRRFIPEEILRVYCRHS